MKKALRSIFVTVLLSSCTYYRPGPGEEVHLSTVVAPFLDKMIDDHNREMATKAALAKGYALPDGTPCIRKPIQQQYGNPISIHHACIGVDHEWKYYPPL
jgi:hypothetical protein